MAVKLSSKAHNEYLKVSHKSYHFRLNRTYDRKLMEYLDSKENMAGYLKTLIKNDMQSQGMEVDEFDTIKLPGETSPVRFFVRGAKGYDGPDKPRRSPGRPRKPVDPDAVEKPKRGRGRPRKNQEATE